MSAINKAELKSVSPVIETQDLSNISDKTGNIYESLIVIGSRANQISQSIKHELHSKLEEFAPTSDTLEEIFENSEQIEISKFYERMPHSTLLALKEFKEDNIFHRHREEQPM